MQPTKIERFLNSIDRAMESLPSDKLPGLAAGKAHFSDGHLEIPFLSEGSECIIVCLGETIDREAVYTQCGVNDLWARFPEGSKSISEEEVSSFLDFLRKVLRRIPPIRPAILDRAPKAEQAFELEGRTFLHGLEIPEYISFDLACETPARPSIDPVSPLLLEYVMTKASDDPCFYKAESEPPPHDLGFLLLSGDEINEYRAMLPPRDPVWSYAGRYRKPALKLFYDGGGEDSAYSEPECLDCRYWVRCLGRYRLATEGAPSRVELLGWPGLPPCIVRDDVADIENSSSDPLGSAIENLVEAAKAGYTRYSVEKLELMEGGMELIDRLARRLGLRRA